MARYYLESGVTNGTLRDGHRFDCSPATRRIRADEQFGAPADKPRTLGFVDTDCLPCQQDLVRLGASLNPGTVPLNADELDFLRGKSTKANATVASLIEQLQALADA